MTCQLTISNNIRSPEIVINVIQAQGFQTSTQTQREKDEPDESLPEQKENQSNKNKQVDLPQDKPSSIFKKVSRQEISNLLLSDDEEDVDLNMLKERQAMAATVSSDEGSSDETENYESIVSKEKKDTKGKIKSSKIIVEPSTSGLSSSGSTT